MSLASLALATRNLLRADLTEFYDNADAPTQLRHRAANCRVMPNHHPPADCGDEFIAIYGALHRPRQPFPEVATDEQFGLTVAVTLRINSVPATERGEAGYVTDPDLYALGWKTIEARCREIIGLIDKNYDLLVDANILHNTENGFSEPLHWVGSDAAPQEVGAEHFCAWHAGINQLNTNAVVNLPGMPTADDTYGLLMHIRFDGAVRFQPATVFDEPVV